MSEDDKRTYTLAEVRNGTGWPEDALFRLVEPEPERSTNTSIDCNHRWVLRSDRTQGITQIRTYECEDCLAHTVLTGPIGTRSPFEVEAS